MAQIPNNKILKSSEYHDILSAKETLIQAQTTAQKILSDAEETRQTAYERGYQKGLQQAQFDAVEQTINLVLESINYLGKLEKDVADIVFSSVRKIIATYEPDELVVQSIKMSIKEISNSKQVLLRAAPELAKVLFNRIPDIENNVNHFNLVADERLEKNHCTIESDLGIIHINVDDAVGKLHQLINSRLQVATEDSKI